jgi:hypothetical protein
MRHASRLAALAVLTALAACSSEEKKPEAPTVAALEADPAEGASVGDWEVLASTSTTEVHEIKVTKLDPSSVTLTISIWKAGAGPERTNLTFDRKHPPAVAELLTLGASKILESKREDWRGDISKTDATFPVHGRLYTVRDVPAGGTERVVKFWSAVEVKGAHIAAFEIVQKEHTTRFEVEGFGGEGAVDWGYTTADVVARKK